MAACERTLTDAAAKQRLLIEPDTAAGYRAKKSGQQGRHSRASKAWTGGLPDEGEGTGKGGISKLCGHQGNSILRKNDRSAISSRARAESEPVIRRPSPDKEQIVTIDSNS